MARAVELRLPRASRTVTPGVPFEITVLCQGVVVPEVTVRGAVQVPRLRRELVRLTAEHLRARHEQRVVRTYRATLPAGLPPSLTVGEQARVEYLVECGSRSLPLVVVRPAQESAARPVKERVQDGAHTLELSVDSAACSAGTLLRGNLAVEGPGVHRSVVRLLRELAVTVNGRTVKHQHGLAKATLPATGRAQAFELAVPTSLPEVELPELVVRHWLEARSQHGFRGELAARLPLTMVTRVGTRPSPPPPVGELARWAALGEPHGLGVVDDRLRGTVAGCELGLWRDGGLLRLQLVYPPLGLELSIARSGWRDLLRRRRVRLGHDGWDRRHRVRVREPGQVTGFLATLAPQLTALGVAHMDDDDLLLEVPGSDEVAPLVHAGVELATAIARARAQILPPAWFGGGWRELAERVGGRLNPGDLELELELAGAPAVLRHGYDAETPTRLTLAVRPPGGLLEAWLPDPLIAEGVRAGVNRMQRDGDAIVLERPAVREPGELGLMLELARTLVLAQARPGGVFR